MNPDVLKIFAQVAGIGGIAFGVFLVLFKDVIRKVFLSELGESLSYKLLRLIVILVWSIAVLGVLGWIYVSIVTGASVDDAQDHPNLPNNPRIESPVDTTSEISASYTENKLREFLDTVENPSQ